MNRDEKRKNINDLERLINNRERLIKEKEEEINTLKDEISTYKRISEGIVKSDVKVLLFKIDTTHPMRDDDDEIQTTYIIYDVELERLQTIVKEGKKGTIIPEDIVDFRDLFKDLGMPESIWPSNPLKDDHCLDIIMNAIDILETYIEETNSKYNFKTWEELIDFLYSETFNKDILNFHIIPDSDLHFKRQ